MATHSVIHKLKVSQVTATPSSLIFGELAYSTNSNTLFIGDPTSTPVAIGGSADHTKLATVGSGATVQSVAGAGAINITGTTANPIVNVVAASTSVPGTMSASDKSKLDGISAGAMPGTVTSVTGSGAIVVSASTTVPNVSIVAATASVPGTMSASDYSKLQGVGAGATVQSVSAGTAVTISGTTAVPVVNVQASSGSVPGTMSASDYTKLAGISPGAQVNSVTSVAGRTGAVVLAVADVSGAAPLASPTFTGTVTVPTPVNASDAASKSYVDGVSIGLDFKESVVAASTGNITVTTGLINGTVIDGVTLSTGNRVLLKNQTTASENGIYIVPASGAANRSPDANTDSAVTKGLFTYVEGGTANSGAAFVLSNKTGTLGSGSLVFTQFGGGATYSAGTGLTLTGTSFSVNNYANILMDGDTLDGGSF